MRSSACGAAQNGSSRRTSPAARPRSACLDGLVAVLLAPTCLACGEPLLAPLAGPVCAACWSSIRPLSPPLCDCCGEPLPSAAAGAAVGDERLLCSRCRREPAGDISLGRSAGSYEGALRELVRALKYDRRRRLAQRLAMLMRERGREVLEGADIVVPVPLHWSRRLRRGFNQAEDLARGLGLPVCRALRRARATRAQFGLAIGARRRNVRGAFRERRACLVVRRWRPAGVAGLCVVLVDDLVTTGATLRECAAVLKRLGAREVRTLTLARALRRPR